MTEVPARWSCERCAGANPPGTRFCGHCGAPAPAAAGRPAEPAPEGAGALEERRLVTSLFADVAGFGPLADRLDPEQLLEIIDPLLTRLSEIVHAYGGRVEKFAGDAVLALFGAPRSHDDDASRALAATLEMHHEVELATARMPSDVGRLALHVGVNTGYGVGPVLPGTFGGDYAVLGDAVVLAQRLESVAPAGETYVGETTYRPAAHAFEFEEVGEVTVKGSACRSASGG